MNYLAAESCGHSERSAIDQSSGSCRRESTGVANSATDTGKKRITCGGCRRNRVLPTRCACCCHEVGKCKHVVTIVLRIRNWIERRRERHVGNAFSGAGRGLMCSGIRGVGTSTTETVELAGDTHLIEIRIAGERKQAGLLCLPAETADTQCIAGFGYRNRSECSTLRDWLRRDVVLQCLVGNC